MNSKEIVAALLVLFSSGSGLHASDPFANVLVKYDFNTVDSDWAPNVPAYCAPCVWTTDLSLNTLNQGWHVGGPDGSKFRCFEGWEASYNNNFVRADLSQHIHTLSYDVFIRDNMMAAISGVSFDWKRPGTTSANSIQASIFWEDSAGAVQHRSSGLIDLAGVEAWNHLDLDFLTGSSELPTGSDTAGRQFHLELYAWGQVGDALYLDNIVLKGQCAPIPEPGGVVMLASAALALMLRRRGRG